MPVARENEEGANTIQTGAAIADNVNSKPGNNRNASSENERKRSVFAGSRSGLNDVSVSNGRKNMLRLRENAGSKHSPSGQGGLPMKEQGASEAARDNESGTQSLLAWPQWRC